MDKCLPLGVLILRSPANLKQEMLPVFKIIDKTIHPSIIRKMSYISMVSCQKGPTRYAYAWQDILDIRSTIGQLLYTEWEPVVHYRCRL